MCYRRILMMTETAEKRLDIPLAPYIQEWYNKTIEVSVNRNARNGRHCNGVGRFAYEHMSCPTEAHTGSAVPAPDDCTGA